MTPYCLEGILLRRLPFKESDWVFTLFTKERGKCTFFMKGRKIKGQTLPSLDPMTCLECIIAPKRAFGMDVCQDVTLLDGYASIRSRLSFLQAAGGILRAILTTQQEEKPAGQLYLLLKRYLKELPLFLEPNTALASFYLKLLKYEGSFSERRFCSVCAILLKEFSFFCGEKFCRHHAPKGSLFFDEAEACLFYHLAEVKYLKEIYPMTVFPSFLFKIQQGIHHLEMF